jgi:hypothetical protein
MYILRVTQGSHAGDFILMDDCCDEVSVLEEMQSGEVGGWSLHRKDLTILTSLEDVKALRSFLESDRNLPCEILTVKVGV